MAAQSEEQVPNLLKNAVQALTNCRPEEHQVGYKFDAWERCFNRDQDLFEINQRFGESISRADVQNLGIEAMTDPAYVRRFALAVMLWGYGTVGYGATRTYEMLSHPQAVERLTRGAELARSGDFVDACLFFSSSSRGRLSKFSWSFFTKYFYFVGLASDLSPMPLILDGSSRENGVAGGMKRLADAGDLGAARAMELWWSTADPRCADGYKLYVELVNQWAHGLDCRPDAVEMALWKGFLSQHSVEDQNKII